MPATIEVSKPRSPDFWAGMAMPVIAPLALVATFGPTLFVRSFVVATLWRWYAVPAFGLPSLSMAYAFGLVLMFGLLSPLPQQADKSIRKSMWDSIVRSALFLAFGWVGTWFL